MKLSEIAQALSAEVIGNAAIDIQRVVHPLDAAGPTDLAVALSREALSTANGVEVGAVLIPADAPRPASGLTLLVYAGDERQAIATLTAMFRADPEHDAGVHPTAVVAADARLGDGVNLGPHAAIGRRAAIGNRTTVLANATVGADAVIGEDCILHPGVVVGDRVKLGNRVIVQANAVIGSDGFGFIPIRDRTADGSGTVPQRIHSLGTVVIGDDVEIGAGTTIDRATLRQTRIGAGTKIDNQVQIGHNVTLGASCLICGFVGIAGSSVIGDGVMIGAGAGLSDHVRVGAGASIGAMSGVATNIPAGVVVSGIPANRHGKTLERYSAIIRLKGLFAEVEALRQRLGDLEKARG